MNVLKSFSVLILAGAFMFSSCDKIDDALSKDIDVKNISFEIVTPVGESDLRADMHPFSGETTISFTDSQFSEFSDYLSHIDNVKIEEVSVFTTTEGSGTKVEDFKLKSSQAEVDFLIYSYQFGIDYIEPQLADVMGKILKAVLNKKTVDLKVTGVTDEVSGKNLKHRITIKKGTVRVKLFK